jgi:hypothetical protein
MCLALTLLSCKERKLEGTSWTLVEAEYKDKPVRIGASTPVVLVLEGKSLNSIEFYEDGTVKLPGLNSPDVFANWKVIDNKIYFGFDSVRYELLPGVKADMTFLETNDSTLDAVVDDDDFRKREAVAINEKNKDSLLLMRLGIIKDPDSFSREVRTTIKIYQGPFLFAFQQGKLFMMSEDSKLIAEPAKTKE